MINEDINKLNNKTVIQIECDLCHKTFEMQVINIKSSKKKRLLENEKTDITKDYCRSCNIKLNKNKFPQCNSDYWTLEKKKEHSDKLNSVERISRKKTKYEYINEIDKIKNIIEGCLLGDGGLYIKNNKENAWFGYSSSSKQHAEFVHQYFKQFCTNNMQEIKTVNRFDKRTNKIYTIYRFSTMCLPEFTEYRNRFYPTGVKIIPKDIQISFETLLFWYIGDGHMSSQESILLHTNCFSLDDINYLCSKLEKYSATPQHKTKNTYVIYIPRVFANIFLQDIGNCPFDEYSHKWKITMCKNTETYAKYHNLYPLILNDYMYDHLSLDKLRRKYKIPKRYIVFMFEENNIKC